VGERAIVVLYLASTCVVVGVPLAAGWGVISFAAVCGAAGAILRWWWAKHYNKGLPRCGGRAALCGAAAERAGWTAANYPAGTLLANLAGTYVLAVVWVVSKFSVSFHDQATQLLLYGVAQGFCGCLTTMSTFVLELHRLPRRLGVVYALTSLGLAQVGWFLIFDARAATLAVAATQTFAVSGPTLSVCANYAALCAALLDRIACPPAARVVNACGGGGSLADFVGACGCGAMSGAAGPQEFLSEALIAAQVRALVPSQFVPVWPVADDGGGGGDATGAVDFCLSYQNVCDTVLNRLQCPPEQRRMDACARAGLGTFKGVCACGSFARPGLYTRELLVDALVTRGYATLSFLAGPNVVTPVPFCANFRSACAGLLDAVACPARGALGAQRALVACDGSAVETFSGTCSCFATAWAAGPRLAEIMLDAAAKPAFSDSGMIVVPVRATAGFPSRHDICASFTRVCDDALVKIGCPNVARNNSNCAGGAGPLVDGPGGPRALSADPARWVGRCTCGALDLSVRVAEWLWEAAIEADFARFIFSPAPLSPFTLVTSANPFRPLLAPGYPPPGSAGL
jgi:fluoride ion exporter CrcB/FEX